MSDITDMVKRDLDQRRAKGTEEYGEPLTTETDIDPLRYAYEEALDLACYLRMKMEEEYECVHAWVATRAMMSQGIKKCEKCGEERPLGL